jgi:myo-inositol-1(or 4)-monophosphatase
MDFEKILTFTKELALEAASPVMEYRSSGTFEVYNKTDRDLVTTADLASEKIIIEMIQGVYPDHLICSEESNPLSADEYDFNIPLWVIDPIDGTTNYAKGHDRVSISIAFAVKGIVQVGVVYGLFTKEMFCAVKGRGAWLNDERITVKDLKDLSSAVIGVGRPFRESEREHYLAQLKELVYSCHDIRRMASAALDLCWVACGKLDGFCETLNPWDFAAGCLIAREAGALTGHVYDPPADLKMPLDLYGEQIIAAPPSIYQQLKDLLKVE